MNTKTVETVCGGLSWSLSTGDMMAYNTKLNFSKSWKMKLIKTAEDVEKIKWECEQSLTTNIIEIALGMHKT